jgi:hypothetical protein
MNQNNTSIKHSIHQRLTAEVNNTKQKKFVKKVSTSYIPDEAAERLASPAEIVSNHEEAQTPAKKSQINV